MKTRIQEIENENFILKFIKDNNIKGIGNFAICQFKNTKKITFKFDFDYMLTNFENCELVFDFNKNLIQCYIPNNNINKYLLYVEEPLSNKENNFNLSSFMEKIGNKKSSFDLLKFNISTELKFSINEKILSIEKNLEFINSFFDLIKNIETFLNNNKKAISNDKSDNFKTIKEFKIIQNNVETLIDKTKRSLIEVINNIYFNKPKYTFEIKGENFIFKSKENECIFCLCKKRKLEIILESNNNSLLSISYTNNDYDIYITINNKNEINMQIINKLIIYLAESTSFMGSIISNSDNNTELFGFEKGKKYLYIGHFIKDNFAGLGLLITPFFSYRGKFSNSNKSDNNGYILFGDENHFYKGGILGDELNGKGKYQNKKGIIIEGNFEKDEIKGICKFTFNNGDQYQGEMIGNIKKGEWNYNNKISGKKLKVVFDNENNEANYIY